VKILFLLSFLLDSLVEVLALIRYDMDRVTARETPDKINTNSYVIRYPFYLLVPGFSFGIKM